ncbi:MAG TPA: hypothetical protein GXZ87_06865 [Bacteroidales bacterium]|nr:hypothetical protein [Bacteroidales bacterium]
MELQEVQLIYEDFQTSNFQPLVKSLQKYALKYTRLRVEWLLSDLETRKEIDEERTFAHNAFISSCDALARNMKAGGEDSNWRVKIGSDRKDIGDFAVLLVAAMGIKAR